MYGQTGQTGQTCATASATWRDAAPTPVSRSSFVGAGKRLAEAQEKLSSTRVRLMKVAQGIIGIYPSSATNPASDKSPTPDNVVAVLHAEIDRMNEELNFVLDAVCALETAVQQ